MIYGENRPFGYQKDERKRIGFQGNEISGIFELTGIELILTAMNWTLF